MTPGARVQAAIEIIDHWAAGADPLGRVVAAWGRASRYAGSGDRRAVADLVYDGVRRLRSAAWLAGVDEPACGRGVVLGSLLLDGVAPAALGALFSGASHAPAPLGGAETARLGRPLELAPRGVRLDLPDWLLPQLAHVPQPALAMLRQRAPLDLRVNRARADPAAAGDALAADGIATEPGPLSPTCLRVIDGAASVAASRAYREGLVEVQDAASQAVADYACARPGETVLDYCAGAGGKALALAAAMEGRGRVYAHDPDRQRLARLPDRMRRAGADICLCPPRQVARLAGRCDLVFVDAPCSGSGTWRRAPDAKWRLTADQLAAAAACQDAILGAAARAVRPGGRLVYATCSMLGLENVERTAAFLDRYPQFRAGRPALCLTPLDGGDGFFASELIRTAE